MTASDQPLDLLVVGAGFAGVYMTHKARELGLRVQAVDKAGGFGGTWYWNRYPGLRCDVESVDYSYSFSDEIQQEWTWREKFSTHDEIRRYIEFVVDRLELRDLFRFNAGVNSARWDASQKLWLVETSDGQQYRSRFVCWATGFLSEPKVPAIDGLEDFGGETYYTGWWPHEGVSFKGKRVAVLGTGSSGLGVIPEVAKEAEQLYVLQRTPSYSVPGFNREIPQQEMDALKANYAAYREAARDKPLGVDTHASGKTLADFGPEAATEALRVAYEYGNGMHYGGVLADVMVNDEANQFAADFLRDRIRERVGDDVLAEKLLPDYRLLTRRLCVDHGYFEIFGQDNVTLVDLREEPIQQIDQNGVQTAAQHLDVDALVLATGFDALTGALVRIDINGRDGQNLAEKWNEYPAAYLGIGVNGFPNSWMINAPTSPAAFSNVVLAIEQQVEWIGGMIEHMQANDIAVFEPEADAEDAWVEEVEQLTQQTLIRYTDAWYSGANVPGKRRVQMVYLGGIGGYENKLNEVAAAGYPGFAFSR